MAVGEGTPVRLEDVSPLSMARILPSLEPKFPVVYQSFERMTYPRIFGILRQWSGEEQVRTLAKFFKDGITDPFPKPDEVAQRLTTFNTMLWFDTEFDPDPDRLQTLTDQFLAAINREKLPISIVRNNWQSAFNLARWGGITTETDDLTTILHLASRMSTDTYVAMGLPAEVAGSMAHDIVFEMAWVEAGRDRFSERDDLKTTFGELAAVTVEREIKWLIAGDLMAPKGFDKGNPFTSLVEMHKSGYIPIGTRRRESDLRDEFAIFVPPILRAA